MMTIEQARKATELADERKQIARAKWNCIAHDPGLEPKSGASWGGSVRYELQHKEPIDEQLAWAIEEFRKRKLDAIDAQLRALGVEPPTMPAADGDKAA
jgi:hypothetical protein